MLRKLCRIAACVAPLAIFQFGTGVPAWGQTRTATGTTLAVTSAGSPVTAAAAGSVVTLTAQVQAGSTALTGGQVNFCDASAASCTDVHLLGTAQLTGAGTAVLKFRPGLGTHSYKAVFAGTSGFAGSSSSAAALTIAGSPYPIASSTSIAETGSWGKYALTATVAEYGGTAAPTGSVSFRDTSNGNAILTTATLGSAVTGLYWATPLALITPTNSPQAAVVGDFNGDGIADVGVSAGGPGQPLVVFLGNANGTYTSVPGPFVDTYTFGPIATADFNGDGNLDMAVLNADSSIVTILLGNGDGTFTVAGSSPRTGSDPNHLAVGDFNGDGLPDLAVSDGLTDAIEILLGKGDGTFDVASSGLALGGLPSSIAVGDFNGDGKLDMAVAAGPADAVSIFLGKGDGTFSLTSTLHSGSAGAPIVAADFTGDGKLDLAVAVAGSTAAADSAIVLSGNGDGTFNTPQAGMIVTSTAIPAMQIGDCNADGIPDLILTDSRVGAFTVLLGSGTGSFQATTNILPGDSTFGLSSAVGDLNGDGRTDLVIAAFASGSTMLYFTEPLVTSTATANVAPAGVGAHLVDADYTGDNDYGSSTSSTIPLWGQLPATATTLTIASGGTPVTSVAPGTAVTLTAAVLAGATPVTSGQVKFCDASASECTDIHVLATAQLTAAGTAAYTYVPGAGAHSYKAEFVQDGFGSTSVSAVSNLDVGPAPPPVYTGQTSIQASGYPGDYTLTATVVGFGGSAAPTGTVSFLDTSFANTVLATAPLGPAAAGLGLLFYQPAALGGVPTSQVTGDFNGDGIPDLAVIWGASLYAEPPYSITLYFGKGDGTFTAGPTTAATGVQEYPLLLAGDFNNDGKTDLAVLSYSYNNISYITTLPGNGDGTFGTPQTGTAYNQHPQGGDFILGQMVAADFNGDGKLDLAVVGDDVSYGGVTILLGNGDGTFTGKPPAVVDADVGAVATGDLNGDGIPDLIGLDYFDNKAIVLLGNGDGTFTPTATAPGVDTFAKSVVIADLNGDGKADLAVGYSGGVTVYLGNGDGTFQSGIVGPANGSGEGLVTGDFNHDGILDLAASNGYYGPISILLGAGNGTFTLVNPILSTTQPIDNPFALVTADFNGDGVPDLALLQTGVDLPSILMTEPTETATASVNGIAPVGAGTHLVDASYPGDSHYAASVSATTPLTAGVAVPVISPSSGTFTAAQSVTIADATPGTTLYYSASGAFNTSGYVPYTGPIPLEGSGPVTIQAYGTATGYQQSQTAVANLTLQFPAAATPVISPAAGSYAGTQSVTMTESSPGATIYYTTDGAYPSTSSSVYTGIIAVSTSEVVVARAIGPGYAWSGVASSQFDIASSSSSFLYTIAGNGTPGYSGDGGPATAAELDGPNGVASDAAGNVYFTDTGNNVVRRIDAATHLIATIAGTGVDGRTGDNGPATDAELAAPQQIAVDGNGNVFVAELGGSGYTVRRIDGKTGTITTFAGNLNGTGTLGGPATSYRLGFIDAIACDRAGNLYLGVLGPVNSLGGVVLEVNAATGVITQIAEGTPNQYGGTISGIAVDGSQNIYVSNSETDVVSKISPAGVIAPFAGGSLTFGGDGGPATQASLSNPQGLAVDTAGNVYIADTSDGVIRKVGTDGIIHTVGGVLSNPPAYYDSLIGGDGVPASSAILYDPFGIAVDGAGNVYFVGEQYRVQMFTAPAPPPASAAAAPVLSLAAGSYASAQTLTIAGSTPGAEIYVTLDGKTPTTATQGYHGPIAIGGSVTVQAIALAPGFLPSAPVKASYTITAPPALAISTVAGDGLVGNSGNGGPATAATLGYASTVALDNAGDLFIADFSNSVVWKVDAATGNIAVVAGTGTPGPANGVNSGPATTVPLYYPQGLAVDKSGNLYIADSFNARVCMVSAQTGLLTTIAGSSNAGVLGDGGPAVSAGLRLPDGLAFDPAGNLYIADAGSLRVRRIDAKTGIITTVAGNGTLGGPIGDGGLATAASIDPLGLAFDGKGNLYITDDSVRVRKVDATSGIVTTVAGTGIYSNSGDGGPATAAAVIDSLGIAVDAAGDIYLSSEPSTIRKVDASTGIIATVAGNGYWGYSGDGGPALVAELDSPLGLALDAAGSLYIADEVNSVVRKVAQPVPAPTPALSLASGTYNGTQTLTITDSAKHAVIYYTTDGTTPTVASTVYGAPIPVSASETVSAIATAPGEIASPVATAVYTIDPLIAPVIAWTAPAPTPYGTALSAMQLDATASVPGTFVYTPAAGTIPPPGNDTLSVLFTPSDTTHYTTATASVTLVVVPAPAIVSLSPDFADAAGPAFSMTVNGSGFTSTSVAYFGSTALSTQFVSSVQLTAQVPPSAIAGMGTFAGTVQNPGAAGGVSNPFQFQVDSPGATATTFTATTATVAPGASATYTANLPSTATSVSAACLNLPAGASCTFSASSGTVTVATSSTTPAGTYQILVVFTETLPGAASGFIFLPILLTPAMLLRRKLAGRGTRVACCVVFLAAVSLAAIGCGGSSGSGSPTPAPQTHQVTTSGNVTLVVQ